MLTTSKADYLTSEKNMNPIKLFLNFVAAIILSPFIPIVALAWLAVWLTPAQQPAWPKRNDVAPKRSVTERKTVQADSVYSFVIYS